MRFLLDSLLLSWEGIVCSFVFSIFIGGALWVFLRILNERMFLRIRWLALFEGLFYRKVVCVDVILRGGFLVYWEIKVYGFIYDSMCFREIIGVLRSGGYFVF